MNAAKAWGELGAQLHEIVGTYKALISALTLRVQDPSAMAIVRAVTPYLAWFESTATLAEQAAIQAKAAAGAYGLALAATVSPHAIKANRLQRISLAAMNFLGQSSPAVADIEADYEQMWAQDAAAMHAYARASADASKVTPFSPPPLAARLPRSSRTWSLTAAPEVISTGYQVISTIPEALDALASSPLESFDASLSSVTVPLSKLSSLSAPADFALNHLNSLNKAAALHAAAALQRPRTDCRNHAAPRASLGSGASIGPMSVPRSWTQSIPRPTWQGLTAGPIDRSQ